MTSARLSDLIEELQSGFACGDSVDDGIVQLRMNNVDTDGRIDFTKTRRVPESAAKDLERFFLATGDVVFNNTNSPELVGKSAVFSGYNEPVVFSNHFTRIRVRRDRLEPRFLARWLGSEWRRGTFARMCNQWVNQASVRKDALLAMKIPAMPVADQRRIADILDKADAVRRKRKEIIALTEELLRSTFLEMFGDPVTNPRGWPRSTFGDQVELLEYGPRFYNERYADDGVRIVRITDLDTTGTLDFSAMPRLAVSDADRARYILRPGDLIFARSGATVGKTALSMHGDPEAIPGAYFIRLRFNPNVLPLFAREVLASERIQQIITSRSRQSAQQNFSGPGIRELPLPLPPLKLQLRFESMAAQRRTLLARYKQCHIESEALFSSVMQSAFAIAR